MRTPEQHDRIHDWPSEMRRPERPDLALGAPVCHGHDRPSELRRPEGDEQPAPANPRHTGIERLTQDDLCGMLPTEIVTYIDVLADERDALLALVAEPRAAAPPSDLDAEAAAHQEHCRLPSCGLCSACLLPWPCLVRRLADAHARCTNLTNAEASRIFTEAREMREERDAALAECAALRAAGQQTLRLIDEAVASCRPYGDDGELIPDGPFPCERFCENFGHHSLLEVAEPLRRALAPTTGGAAGEGT